MRRAKDDCDLGHSLVDLSVALAIAGIVFTSAIAFFPRRDQLSESVERLVGELESSAIAARNLGEDLRVTCGRSVHLALSTLAVPDIDLPQRIFCSVEGPNGPLLVIRRDGTATPGRIVLADERGGHCEIIQSLRSARRVHCER